MSNYVTLDETCNSSASFDPETEILRIRDGKELVVLVDEEIIKLRDFLNTLPLCP